MKKLVSVLMALIMVFAMGTVAFAETTVMNEEELKEALKNNGKVVLGDDITVTSTLEVPAGKTVSVDLAGYDITGSGISRLIHVANTATLNITDSSDDESGVIELTTTGNGSTINVEGNLNLYSGEISFKDSTYSGISYAVEVQPNAWGTAYTEGTVFHMYGGSIYSDTYGIRVASYSSELHEDVSATFIMDDGEITSTWACVFVQQPNATHDNLTVIINDGHIENMYPDYYQAIQVYGPAATDTVGDVETPTNITVSGGEFIGSITVSSDIGSEMNFEISGGTFSELPSEEYLAEDAVITVGDQVFENTEDGLVCSHKDEDKDHLCDYANCGKEVGEHSDADKDHLCDVYGDECANGKIGEHSDADKDHLCDVYGDECANGKIGEHKDDNKDHACDYGCTEAIGDCSDKDDDGDHECDYGCGKTLTNHEYGRWVKVYEPTETEPGVKVKTCHECGKKVYADVAPLSEDGIEELGPGMEKPETETESNPNTGAPVFAPAVILLSAAAAFFKKR